MQDCKSLRAAVTICATLVNIQTHTETDRQGGFKGGSGPRPPCEKSGLPVAPTARSEVNDAGILLNYV